MEVPQPFLNIPPTRRVVGRTTRVAVGQLASAKARAVKALGVE
jgi:hypothetical protein